MRIESRKSPPRQERIEDGKAHLSMVARLHSGESAAQAVAGSLLLLDQATQNLHFAHATGEVSEELKKLPIPMGQGIGTG